MSDKRCASISASLKTAVSFAEIMEKCVRADPWQPHGRQTPNTAKPCEMRLDCREREQRLHAGADIGAMVDERVPSAALVIVFSPETSCDSG